MIVQALSDLVFTAFRLLFSFVPSFSNATLTTGGFSISYYINYIMSACAYFLPLTELFGLFSLYIAITNWEITYRLFWRIFHIFKH